MTVIPCTPWPQAAAKEVAGQQETITVEARHGEEMRSSEQVQCPCSYRQHYRHHNYCHTRVNSISRQQRQQLHHRYRHHHHHHHHQHLLLHQRYHHHLHHHHHHHYHHHHHHHQHPDPSHRTCWYNLSLQKTVRRLRV